jgi:hypothetical protein
LTYRNLEDKLLAVVLSLQGVENLRQLGAIELDIDDGTDDLVDLADTSGRGAGESAGRESERGRAKGTSGSGGREGRASRPGEGGNAALEHLAR